MSYMLHKMPYKEISSCRESKKMYRKVFVHVLNCFAYKPMTFWLS